MGHGKERIDKNCLNCGTTVEGRFCQNCGQENIVPGETLWQMIRHFFEDITHYDGKFFSTLKLLLTRPGFLSKEYVSGRRQRYLHPVRMYVFTSALFFLVFFALGPVKVKLDGPAYSQTTKDSIINSLASEAIQNDSLRENIEYIKMMTDSGFKIAPLDYEYLIKSGIRKSSLDSLEIVRANRLEANKVGSEDAVIADAVNKRLSRMVESEDSSSYFRDHYVDGFLHKFPMILFVSLPFFAYIMQFLFFRHKEFRFFHHSIFTIHLYIFSFIASLLVMLFAWAADKTGWSIFSILMFIALIYALIYPFIAIKSFYKTTWIKAFFKWALMYLLGIILFGIIAMIFATIQFFLL